VIARHELELAKILHPIAGAAALVTIATF